MTNPQSHPLPLADGAVSQAGVTGSGREAALAVGEATAVADIEGNALIGAEVDSAVIGAGPAGLMAAEQLASSGYSVAVYDAMPSAGRKFLLAGKGGLNLTHSEDFTKFVDRFGPGQDWAGEWLREFGPDQLRHWAAGLGVATFVGSSGRVFPHDMKAAPLLRAWLHRLRLSGVRLHQRHRWVGEWAFVAGRHELAFNTPGGQGLVRAKVVVLALGGGSWSRLGSDGAWVPWLARHCVSVVPLQPSNCGFEVARVRGSVTELGDFSGDHVPRGWSEHLATRFAGAPLKNVALRIEGPSGVRFAQRGECVLSSYGLEGSLVYAASATMREALKPESGLRVTLDLLPALSPAQVDAEVARPRGSRSLATHLKSRLGLDGAKAALLHELLPRETLANAGALAQAIKALPLPVVAARPIDEAISTAGGVPQAALDGGLMLRQHPGIFCCGEMLDWEAPTGGYLLTASMASGVVAGRAAARLLAVK